MKKRPKKQSREPLKEGEDYYLNEQGLMVFTKTWHLRRGYCCESGCKHCPWKEPPISKPLKPDDKL